jgi:polysaccharide export outer membrane protein
MLAKRMLVCLLIWSLIAPCSGWGQQAPQTDEELKNQAQIYLQKFGPGPVEPPKKGALAPPQPPTAKELPKAPEKELPAEPPSDMELRSNENGMPLKQFGFDFFLKPPSSFLPVTEIPVGPDYLIGPQDAIRILLWGNVQEEYRLTVDRNGQIAIPKVGVVHVSGLTFRQLQEVLNREFSSFYNNFQMNVTMDNLRSIQVFVVGQARFPGSYAISSLSTLVNALFASGGPSKSGSMRKIQVRRGGKVVVTFDLYDFLLKGDKTKDIRLMPQDVIFIPVIGEQVAIGGPVKKPAIFELKKERTLTDLLRLSGGLAATAFKKRVQVLRIKDRASMVLIEDDLETFITHRVPDIVLKDGDLVKVFPVPSRDIKEVRVDGAVQNPGKFGFREGMRVRDLMTFAGGVLSYSNLEEAEIVRVLVTPEGPRTSNIIINLRRALSGAASDDILLKPNDYLFVRTVPEWTLYKLVKIEGEVKLPGNYAIHKGETLSSVLTRAGGFTDKAYLKGAVFTRVAVKELQERRLKEALDRLQAEMMAASLRKTATSLEKEEAQQQEATFKQQQILLAKLKEVVPTGRVVIRLNDPERLRGTAADIELREGDTLTVPQIQQTVNVLGSVVNPTAVMYDPYMTVKDYVQSVGGPTKDADVKRTYVIRVNGAAVSKTGWIGNVDSMRLDPGDTIIVPEEIEHIAWLKEIKDVATIIGQIALTAGVVLVGLK